MAKEKEILEVAEVQIMLGKEQGVDGEVITPGFWFRMSECIEEFMKKEKVEILALHQRFAKDDEYQGVSRDFHVNRGRKLEENKLVKEPV
jgi:hypothetical protein